jgi:hypothetical protein
MTQMTMESLDDSGWVNESAEVEKPGSRSALDDSDDNDDSGESLDDSEDEMIYILQRQDWNGSLIRMTINGFDFNEDITRIRKET